MQFLLMALFAAGIVAVDQLSKFWTVANIPLHGQIPVIDGLFHLTYAQNTGAAFSAFEGAQWLFVLVFALLTAGILWEFPKKKMPFTTLERWCIVAIYAGGIGNMIDRLWLGYVGYDRGGVYELRRVQCGRQLHHLRRHSAAGPSGPVQQGILEG